MIILLIIILLLASVLTTILWRTNQRAKREAYIRSFAFPRGIYAQLQKRHPQLAAKDLALLNHGLRQFFLAYLKSGYQFVAMPSQVADDFWHEFILYTKNYEQFCRKAFGRFLHHTPAAILTNNRQANTGLRRCWRYACKEENISPRNPSRLPLLFALDSKLAIANGFIYATNCHGPQREGERNMAGNVYCGNDFASDSFDGGTSGLDDDSNLHSFNGDSSDSSSSGGDAGDSSSCGGGDSGGCGGGCGGGD